MKRKNAYSRLQAIPLAGYASSPLVLLLICVILVAYNMANPAALQGVRMQAADMTAPLVRAVSTPVQNVSAWAGEISGLSRLRTENARLRAENARLRDWYQTALSLRAENESLRDLLSMKPKSGGSFITARLYADSGNTYIQSFLLAAGADDGVEKGQAVLSGMGLIGRVIETGDHTSRILLLNDRNSRIPVKLEESGQRAIAAGTNKPDLDLLHLPADAGLEAGMRVVTSGHGGMLPPDLPIGRIVEGEEGGFAIRMLADLGRVSHVRIMESRDGPEIRAIREAPPRL